MRSRWEVAGVNDYTNEAVRGSLVVCPICGRVGQKHVCENVRGEEIAAYIHKERFEGRRHGINVWTIVERCEAAV